MSEIELKFSLHSRNKLVDFVEEETLLAYSSNSVLFFNVESGDLSVFRPTSLRNIDVAAVQSAYHLFAVAEKGMDPKLQVFQYPECKLLSTLSGVAKLEYIQLAFSNSVYLAAVSGVPDFKVAVWDVYTGNKLVESSYDMDVHPSSMVFNPGNWHQFCIISSGSGRLSFWDIEQSLDFYKLRRNDIRLPFIDEPMPEGSEPAEQYSDRSGSLQVDDRLKDKTLQDQQQSSDGITNTQKLNQTDVPRFAMAELVSPFAEEFEIEPFDRTRLQATFAAFNGKNELIIACKSGHLLSVNISATYEVLSAADQALAQSPAKKTRFLYGIRCILRPANKDDGENESGETNKWYPQPGDIDKFLVHASCLLCVCKDSGLVRVVQNAAPYQLLCELDTGAKGVSSINFSSNYDHLALLTANSSILMLTNFAHSLPNEMVNDNSASEPSKPKHQLNIKELPGTNALEEAGPRSSGVFKKPFLAVAHFGGGDVVAVQPVGTEPDVAVLTTSGGCIQTWDISQHLKQLGAIFLPQQEEKREWCITASCPAFRMVVAGTKTGEIYFVDIATLSHPRLVNITRLSRKAVIGLKFDAYSHLLIALTADNTLFVIDPRPSKSFQTIGFINLPGEPFPNALSVLSTSEGVEGKVSVAIGYKPFDEKPGAQAKLAQQRHFTKVLLYQLDSSKLKQTLGEFYVHQIRREFKESVLGKLSLTLSTPSTALVLVDHHRLCTLSASKGRVVNFSLSTLISAVPPPTPSSMSTEGAPSTTASSEVLQPIDYGREPLVQLPTANGLIGTPDNKWLLLPCADGHVRVVSTDDQAQPHTTTICPPVDKRLGGLKIKSITSSGDNRYLMAAGEDGSAVCMQFGLSRTSTGRATRNWTANVPPHGWAESVEECHAIYNHWRSRCRDLAGREVRVLESMPVFMPPKKREKREESHEEAKKKKKEPFGPSVYNVKPIELPHDTTVVESLTARAIFTDDEKVQDQKSKLLATLVHIRERLHIMMTENGNKPELEKLDHHEFDLDAAEQARLLQEGDNEAKKLKQQLEADVSARNVCIQRIKRECIDTLKVKSKGIRGMTSQLRVNNYPLREKTPEELALLDTIHKIREAELVEFKHRVTDRSAEHAPGTTEEGEAAAAAHSLEATDGAVDASDEVAVPETRPKFMQQQGSFGPQFGADYALFYDQFSLQTRDQKLCQITMLKDCIYMIKEAFNKEFEEACRKKENEMNKIKEKNGRLRQIQNLLSVFDKREVSNLIEFEPHATTSEDTEKLFTCEDSEVPAERWISPAERKRLEEAEKAERERLIRERGDNPRERGLMDMMGGVLEVKKEDELRKEVPTPTFILEEKPESDWTDEEQKAAAEYHKKKKELQEERDKYRKVVDTEARKLRQQVSEAVATYEEQLRELFKRKLKTEMAIYQEELKISRIQLDLVVEACFSAQIAEFRRRVDDKRTAMLLSQKDVADARDWLNKSQERYDVLVAEDKVLEKGFRREFADAGSQGVDLLVRQFRRRPKGIKTGAQLVQALSHAAGSGNPFADRPSTATQQHQVAAQLESALVDLDKDTNCPEGIDPSIWRRLCDYRRQKIEKEYKIREQAVAHAESQAFMAHRMQDQDTIRYEMDHLTMEIARFESELERFILNLQVQLVVKQGQVEVKNSHPECSLLPNLEDAVLVHRSVVEQLNACILQKGAAKISNMERAKKTKRDIVRLEWEHRRLEMEMTDLDQKLHDIDHLRVTREVQHYLSSSDYDSRIHEEMSNLEKTLVAQQQFHLKAMDRLRKMMDELETTHVQREESNNDYDDELTSLNLKVSEQRRMVEVVSGEIEIDAARRRRLAGVINRSRLVEVARAQASEIAVLRQEVERLRLKTFPALVQLD